jgi:hypothetical protein
MNIHGSRTLDAPRDAVFAAIMDPQVLLGVIPGCREIVQTSPTDYHGSIALRLPGIAGTFQTDVHVVEAEAPRFGVLEGTVSGAFGSLDGRATFRLIDDEAKTTVDYDGHATIHGPLARLDSRFVASLAGSLIGQGLDALDTRLQGATHAMKEDAR